MKIVHMQKVIGKLCLAGFVSAALFQVLCVQSTRVWAENEELPRFGALALETSSTGTRQTSFVSQRQEAISQPVRVARPSTSGQDDRSKAPEVGTGKKSQETPTREELARRTLKNMIRDWYLAEQKKTGKDLKSISDAEGSALEALAKHIENKTFEGKVANTKDEKKYFFITYGPPGSGKSMVLGEAKRMWKKLWPSQHEFKNDAVNIIVDLMIDAIPKYEEERSTCKTLSTPKEKSDCKQALYWGARSHEGLRIDDISDRIRSRALKEGHNIVMEMTGRRLDPTWFSEFVRSVTEKHYEMVVLYPVSPVQQLVDRTIAREKEKGQEAAPPDRIMSNAGNAAKIIMTMSKEISTFLLFDNSVVGQKTMPLLFARLQTDNFAPCQKLQEWMKPRDAGYREPTSEIGKVEVGVKESLQKFICSSQAGGRETRGDGQSVCPRDEHSVCTSA